MPGSLDTSDTWFEPIAHALKGEGATAFLARLQGPPGLAAFDADGTLWDGDLGEEVFKILIEEERLPTPHPDPWGEYARLVRTDPVEGFAFSGRILRGVTEADLRAISKRAYSDVIEPRAFPELRWLLRFLRERGWDVYVVSASNRWSIEIAVESLGVPANRILALDIECQGGALTDQVRTPIPTLAGKSMLLAAAASRAPDLAFGNSTLDLPLLLSAQIPVAVGSVSDAPRNRFLVQALRRGWARLEVPERT